MSSDPDDLSLVSSLMAAVATTLDRAEAARRRRLPAGIGAAGPSGKRARDMERRAALERVAAQRVALSAARAGLPGFVLASKIAPRAFGGVNAPDATCARHALAVAALVARDMPSLYAEQLAQLVSNSLELWNKTGVVDSAVFSMLLLHQIVCTLLPLPPPLLVPVCPAHTHAHALSSPPLHTPQQLPATVLFRPLQGHLAALKLKLLSRQQLLLAAVACVRRCDQAES